MPGDGAQCGNNSGASQAQFVRPKNNTQCKKKKKSAARVMAETLAESAARVAAGCKLVARRQPLPLCLLGLPAIWMTMCMGIQLCVCVCAVGNEDDII